MKFTLIKNAVIYAPERITDRCVLLCGEKIVWIGESLAAENTIPDIEIVDAQGMFMTPGIVDGHVHITGGGGEGGPATRTPELVLSDMISGGVTSVIGVRGTDDVTRSMAALVGKTNGLIQEGVSAWCLTGSYQIPAATLTGSIREDIAMIDRIIGIGEVALSDHRSSQPSFEEFIKAVAAARVGGMIGGKSGVVNIHIGSGAARLNYLFRAAEETDIPFSQFTPTHMNRNSELFAEAIHYGIAGGYVDFTTSTTQQFLNDGEVKCSSALRMMLNKGIPASRISFSSDGQGSMPLFTSSGQYLGLTIGKVTSILSEFRDAVSEGVSLEDAIRVTSTTTAEHYKLPCKGRIKDGYDADLLLLNSDLELRFVFARGKIMMMDGENIATGTFEHIK